MIPRLVRIKPETMTCPACAGTGWLCDHAGRCGEWIGVEPSKKCPTCDGTGNLVRCRRCKGLGGHKENGR